MGKPENSQEGPMGFQLMKAVFEGVSMKKRIAMFSTLAAVLFAAAVGVSQTTPVAAASRGKVGIIDIQTAILDCAEGKKAFSDLQAKFKPRQEQIREDQQSVLKLQNQLQTQAATLSGSEQRRLTRELQEKETMLKREEDDAQTDFTYDRQDVVRRIGRKMVQVIGQYAQQHGFSLVIDASTVPVYYAAHGLNITGAIVAAYDAKYPPQSASATPPAAPTSASKSATDKPKP
jgi:outer membrane protein